MPVQSRADRPASNAREALLDAAVAEFSSKGYEASTVADIARRAGVTTGAVYAHFRSKLDLLLEALGLGTADRFLEVALGAARAPADELAHELARGLVHAPMGRRGILLLDVIVFARHDAEVAEALARVVATHQEAFERMTQAGIEAGIIDPALPEDELARLVLALAFGMMVQRAIGQGVASEAALSRFAEQVLRPAPEGARGRDAHLARVNARAAAAERARASLRDAVAQAAAAGHSLRRLGEAAGLSHERIRVMLADHASST
jgi:AcrR family transcriptional regulator